MITDCLENIISWEQKGGIGVLIDKKIHKNYITVNNPIELVKVVLSMDHSVPKIFLTGDKEKDDIILKKANEKSLKEPVDNDEILLQISKVLKRYNCRINLNFKYHTAIKEKRIIDKNYNFERFEKIYEEIQFYKDLIDKKIVLTYKITNEMYSNLLKSFIEFFCLSNEKDKKVKTKTIDKRKWY